jgi:hypothetical protein
VVINLFIYLTTVSAVCFGTESGYDVRKLGGGTEEDQKGPQTGRNLSTRKLNTMQKCRHFAFVLVVNGVNKITGLGANMAGKVASSSNWKC